MKAALARAFLAISILMQSAAAEPVLCYDAFAPSCLTAEQFDTLLDGTALSGCGGCFAALETKYGVNGLFALSVCHLESGLGQYQANKNNCFGFMGSDGRYMAFTTPERGIRYFGQLLSGSLYAGKTIDQIAAIYCPGNQNWSSDVQWLMGYHFGRLEVMPDG